MLLHCQVAELKSVLNMNFGDWELFKLVLGGMREDEQSSPAPAPARQLQGEEGGEGREGEVRARTFSVRKQSNIEKQVAMEEATVSGLLSTLNEDAKEDILLEELDNAMEAATKLSQSPHPRLEHQPSHEPDESDVLYYSHPSAGSKVFSREDVTAAADTERGRVRVQSADMIWSAASSRAGSTLELDSLGPGPQEARVRRGAARTNTAPSFLKPRAAAGEEEDPYSWLSATAPPSPRDERSAASKQIYFSDSNTQERESDPGCQNTRMSIFGSRPVKRTKKRPDSRECDQDESDENTGLSRTSSRVRIDRLKRRVKNALIPHEPGQLPMVQKAKPNQDEYQQFSRSQKTSRASSISESVCLSDESLEPEPEQLTIARRPDGAESVRPGLQNLFPAAKEEEEFAMLTATLPDGSKMTSTKKIFTIGDSEKQDP